MNIEHQQQGGKGVFLLTIDGEPAAEMTYTMAGPEKMIVDHTEVLPEFEGQGLGKKLVEHLVQYSRETGIKVLPLCPYAKAQLLKHKEWHDVLV